MDRHYLQGIFRLPGDNLVEEFDRFLADLRPVVDQMYAEHLLRPLESGCFELTEIPDAVLAEIFTLPRLNTIFPGPARAGLDYRQSHSPRTGSAPGDPDRDGNRRSRHASPRDPH
ncbi:hypothetical protein ECZU51_62710 [Escherichia coli]|nr:hypothetical protein ECZU51_62710 [Escherichia coli]